MKPVPNARLREISKRLKAELVDYNVFGVHVIRKSFSHLITAFSFQPTVQSLDQRWLECYVMPLFRPIEYIAFTWGHRIPHIEGRDTGPVVVSGQDAVGLNNTLQAIRGQGLDFHHSFSDIHGFMKLVLQRSKYWWAGRPLSESEEAAYGALLADMEKSKVLELFTTFQEANLESELKFRQDEVERSMAVRRLFENKGQFAAKRKLIEFEESTVRALGLEAYWVRDANVC